MCGESTLPWSLAVVAFRDGGVAAVGAVTAAGMATAALVTPFLATIADEFGAKGADLGRGGARRDAGVPPSWPRRAATAV